MKKNMTYYSQKKEHWRKWEVLVAKFREINEY